MMRHAMLYAQRGLRVLPIEPRGKRPLTPRGVHDATSDPLTIRTWWTKWPQANIAIAVPLEWRVVDVDVRAGGDVELERLQRRHRELPETVTARTGGGGEHRLFAFPRGERMRGQIGPGIDLLGTGKYFLVAPSVHPSGSRYRWTCAPGTQIAQAPEWLINLARPKEPERTAEAPPIASASRYAQAALAHAAAAVATAGEGSRNRTLNSQAFSLARLVARGDITKNDIIDTLVAAARRAGLDETEATKTISSAVAARERAA